MIRLPASLWLMTMKIATAARPEPRARRSRRLSGSVVRCCGSVGVGLRRVAEQARASASRPAVSQVGDASLPHRPADHGRLAVEPAIAGAVAEVDVGVRRRKWRAVSAQMSAASSRISVDPTSFHRLIERVVLLDAAAERVDERAGLALRIERVELVLHAGARAEQQMASLLHIGQELRGERIVDDIERWRDQQFVTVQAAACVGIDDVDGLTGGLSDALQRRVEAQQHLLLVVVPRVRLEVDGPARVVVVQDGDLRMGRGAGERGAGEFEVAAKLRDLRVDGQRLAVGADDGAVVLLLPVERAAPLPVEDRVGAVADGLPRERARLARRRARC